MAALKQVILVISEVVLIETQRNLARYSQELATYFDLVTDSIAFEFIDLSRDEILEASEHLVLKDAPILAAARKARVDLLVTLDKKHLLNKPELMAYAGLEIVTPGEAIACLKK